MTLLIVQVSPKTCPYHQTHLSPPFTLKVSSNAAESLDRSVTPQASAKLDNQAVCPRQLRSTTLLQRHAQPLHQLENYLHSNFKSENTIQSRKKT